MPRRCLGSSERKMSIYEVGDEIHETTTEARGRDVIKGMRSVLFVSIALTIAAFLIIWWIW